MGFWVLEDTAKGRAKLAHVPGTVLLNDEAHGSEITAGLKHGAGRSAHIVLNPQPSEDPNDPLNWSRFKKEMVLIILCFGAILHAGTNGPMMNPNYFEVSLMLHKDINTVVLTSGYNILAIACSGPFINCLSRRYGKRPAFLISSLFDIIGTAICESAVTYKYLLAGRIVMGFATSAYESLIVSAVGDMYFVHQRGLRLAFINFVLNAASSLSSIICGQVFHSLGYLWLFHLFQIFCCIQFVLLFLFCPETTYNRDARYNTDVVNDEKLDELAHIEEKNRAHHEYSPAEKTITSGSASPVEIPKKKTFVQELAIYTGVYSHDNFLKYLVSPFVTLLNPADCYAVIASGLVNAWYVGSAIILATIFSGPPWMFNSAQVGYLGAGPFIGGMLGSIFVAVCADPVIKWMTKRNNGVYEPEFRLVFQVVALPTSGIGMFMFGHLMAIGAAAPLCAFMQGLMMFGVLIAIFSSISYGLDAFRSISNETFIMNMLFKNFMFYALSNFANPWVIDNGPEQIMYVFGGTTIFLCLLAFPVYIFGKRLRSWWARHNLFEKWGMNSSGPEIAGAH
ncbi:hypothetical protein B7463_g9248, partial [Scytalidium lignicola]